MSVRNLFSGIFLAAIFVVGGFAACSEKTPDQQVSAKGAAAAVADDLREVHGVTAVDASRLASDGLLAITVSGGSIFQNGESAKDALAAVQKFGASIPYRSVVIALHEVLVDRYGRESEEPLFALHYGRDDVDKMNFKNLLGWDVLNLAEVESTSPLSRGIAAQECSSSESNAKYAATFCLAATAAK